LSKISWFVGGEQINYLPMPKGEANNQHELHLWIYYMSKFLNTSEFIIMINSWQILNLS
jgi:hypothetical protein